MINLDDEIQLNTIWEKMTKNDSAVQSSPNLLSSSGDKSISPKGTKLCSNFECKCKCN